MNRIHRRQFGLAALSATVPSFLFKTGLALADDPKTADAKDARVLVIVQMAGGNDGLNTLIPFTDERYYQARPKIAVEKGKALKLTDALALHPEMSELAKLFEAGCLAVVPNVGYPNPSRSHFRSMDIWETASSADKSWKTGWIGRYFDNECSGVRGSALGLRLGEQSALTFVGQRNRTATLANPSLLISRANETVRKGLEQLHRVEPTGIETLDFVQRTANETQALSKHLRDAVRDIRSDVDYPPFALCQSLKLTAQMIAANVPTRVYYVTIGGFDTHSAQANRHAALLQELSQALALFHADLKAKKLLDRVALMTFSEFGRRVDENQQQGTDHGTANVMFLLGGAIKPGIHGHAPNLEKLDEQGDLMFQTDFRAVYAAVLAGWLNADAVRTLGGRFEPVPVL